MKVLVLSPEKKDKESRKRRLMVVRALEDLKVKLLNPAYGRPPQKKQFRPLLFPQMFYEAEIELLKKADWVIADLTDPDFRTGFLVSKASEFKKMILGLFWEKIKGETKEMAKENEFLFFDCFNKDNVRLVIRNFFHFLKEKAKKRGKLIVIDGTDGSGKETQSRLLVDYLLKKNFKVKYIDFPRYYSSFHGGLVGRYLNGEFGGLNEVNPYLASLTYALDRLTARDEINEWLKNGYFVIANRYTSSNMAHQTARIEKERRKEFLNWLLEMEYKVHKLPKEDLVLFLHVPVEIGQKLVDNKKEQGYRKRKRDLHEASLKHLYEAEKMYLYLAKKFKHWIKIESVDQKGNLLTINRIHREIIKVLRKKRII